ncbi:YceI family protein [Tsukamurella asaccharolytica]|uniref:YceI family protein n=1 Tax=Tsukamurella asaccharolytica TaxID=2592067 RepID=A0A5C5R6N0_9ACTN|nr:YceI family protein [Tsukamurella asaccharolytica]
MDQSSAVLEVHTGVAGRSARLGHRLVLAPTAWRAAVEADGGQPVAVTVTVDAASLEVVSGEGGLTPLTAPERAVATANAHRSLKVKTNPTIEYRSTAIDATENGYRVRGELTICGTTRPCDFALLYEEAAPAPALAAAVPVRQTDFGIKPFSLMMGTLQVADEVTVVARATV